LRYEFYPFYLGETDQTSSSTNQGKKSKNFSSLNTILRHSVKAGFDRSIMQIIQAKSG
jgi:hypothetical protein